MILEPRDRVLLTNALRPPDGHELDFAVGTTYSLDLLTLLTMPLSFAWFDRSGDRPGDAAESVEVLGGLQKYAKRICIYCQTSRIAWPRQRYPHLAFLEETVAECVAPNGGAFHPKVWVLRFVAEDGHLVYRMLCLSRNLTAARSWDTIVVLDGEVSRRRTVADSVPLADFVAALPSMALRGLPAEKALATARLAEELRSVEFACPDGFDTFQLWPLGFGRHRGWPFGAAGSRLLVVSPFVAVSLLDRIAGDGSDSILVSTPDALKELPRRPQGFSSFYVLDDRAVADMSDTEADSPGGTGADAIQLSGLHAKVFASDVGRDTQIWTGSANATEAAFGGNVEFLVQLTGPRHRVGLDKLLTANRDSAGFRDILIEADTILCQPSQSEEDVRGEQLVEEGRLWAALCIRSLVVEEHDGAFDVIVAGDVPVTPVPEGVKLRCWPTTLSFDRAVSLSFGSGVFARFEGLTFEALTTFLAVEVTAAMGRNPSVRFVLNLPLEGAPPDRRDRILRSLIRDQARLARYLWMLLADGSDGGIGLPVHAPTGSEHGDGHPDSTDVMPSLFELLLRTLQRHPQRLDDIAGLLKGIGDSGEDRETFFPPGFEEVWEPIWAIRERARSEGQR